jgi:hypothetical protein
MSTLSFTPHHALGGGVLLGIAVIGKLALSGRVLGVSGAFKGLVRGDAGAVEAFVHRRLARRRGVGQRDRRGGSGVAVTDG